jgi:hypothetical protein
MLVCVSGMKSRNSIYDWYMMLKEGLNDSKLAYNGWRYGLVKADHYRPIEERNLIQPLLTIPLVINWAVLKRKHYVRF